MFDFTELDDQAGIDLVEHHRAKHHTAKGECSLYGTSCSVPGFVIVDIESAHDEALCTEHGHVTTGWTCDRCGADTDAEDRAHSAYEAAHAEALLCAEELETNAARDEQTHDDLNRGLRVHIHTAGELHPAPEVQADITLNLSRLLSDPAHTLPERLRELDGTDGRVEDLVFATPGAKDIYASLVRLIDSALGLGKDVTVLILCRGGRHRSVAFGENLAHDYCTTVTHHHKHLPVVRPA